jgi:threonine synthase
MTRVLDAQRVQWPTGGEANPYIRYRALTHGYHLARAAGRTDDEISAEIETLDDAVANVDGHGFVVTPMRDRGDYLYKDETVNVSGSHKARHLFGTMLSLRLAEVDDPARPLAIASCGNAALAAAIIARAAERELFVFVPTEADDVILERLSHLGARVEVCQRRPGEAGDPTVARLRAAIADGALPFTCQGNVNGLAIEGGLTLGYELVDDLRAAGRRVDHLFIQVGGGALASSVVQALTEAVELGALDQMPRIHAVQTRDTHPLARAYELVQARLKRGMPVDEAMAWATQHRSRFMWPWESEPHSVASGILDDETYDWRAVLQGMLDTGGKPVLVDEPQLRDANSIARWQTGVNVDATGSAGLAGLLALRKRGAIGAHETCAVLFTGIRRNGGTP